jgi:hypothetical protein
MTKWTARSVVSHETRVPLAASVARSTVHQQEHRAPRVVGLLGRFFPLADPLQDLGLLPTPGSAGSGGPGIGNNTTTIQALGELHHGDRDDGPPKAPAALMTSFAASRALEPLVIAAIPNPAMVTCEHADMAGDQVVDVRS